MPDAAGRFKGISIPALPWHRAFDCAKCQDYGMIPDPDRGSGDGPYWDTPCDCRVKP